VLKTAPLIAVSLAVCLAFMATPSLSGQEPQAKSDGNADALPCVRNLCACDWTEAWSSQDKAEVSSDASGLRVKWTPEKINDKLELANTSFGLKGVGLPDAVFAEIENLSSSRAFFAPVLSFKGEWLLLKPQELKQGANSLSWSLPGDITSKPKELKGPLFMQELRFISKDGQPCEFILRKVAGRQELPRLDALRVEAETGDPLRLVAPEETAKAVLRLSNDAETPVEASVSCFVHGFFDEAFVVSKSLVVPPRGFAELPLAGKPLSKGVWQVDYTIKAVGAKAPKTGRSSFCVIEPVGQTPLEADSPKRPKPGSEFLFGIMAHSNRWGPYARELEIKAASLCGAKLMRTDIGWFSIQPNSSDDWKWQTTDAVVDGYLKAGLELDFIAGYTPRWAAPPEAKASKSFKDWFRSNPADLDAWGRYAEELAKRYKGKIRFYEIWNEPDLDFFRGTADEYLKLFKIAAERMKPVDPGVILMNGGFGTIGYHPTAKKGFQMEVMTRGQDMIDMHAIHEHNAFAEFQSLLDGPHAEIRAKLNPPKPLICNETAIPSLGGERHQAETLWKKLVYAWSRGAVGYVWYDLRNDGYSPTEVEHNYGMLTHDFHPKAVYPAYNALAKALRGKRFVERLEAGAGVYAFLFSDAKESVLAYWLEEGKGAKRCVAVSGAKGNATAIDIMDNRAPAPRLGEILPVEFSETPALLVFDAPGANPKLGNDIVEIDGLRSVKEGEAAELDFHVSNPSSETLSLKLELALQKGHSSPDKPLELELAPGETKKLSFSVVPPEGAKLSQAISFAPAIKCLFKGGAKASACSPTSIILKRGDCVYDENVPDMVLASHDCVVNFQEKDPNITAGLWLGPEDLSAKVFLHKNGEKLSVRIDVNDDVHSQDFKGPDAWQGDSVQFGFVVPRQSGYWELSLARLQDGSPDVYVSSTPTGMKSPAGLVKLKTEAVKGGIRYEAELPYEAFGLTDSLLENGIRFGLIVNDNDGKGRKGWLQSSRGIGESKNPGLFPVVSVRSDKQ